VTEKPLYTLRDYQEDALTALAKGLDNHNGTGPWPAVVSPTGSGKTVMFAEKTRRHLEADRGRKVLVGVHRDELAKQAAEKMRAMVPGARVGIVKAERNEVNADIIIGSVPTLANARRREAIRGVTLGIADECHHAWAPTWQATMGHYAAGGAQWVGFTATMARQSGYLGDIWDPVYVRQIEDAIADGSVLAPRGFRIQVESLELEDVKRSRGDLQASDLSSAMMDADAGNAIARAMLEHGPARRWAVFCPDVPTSYQFAEDIRAAGMTCETVTGDTPEEVRAAIYARFQSGETQVLTNCMVLTEGWDAPWCDGIVVARPTESAALYVQMVGRGLRPFPAGGKTDCIVLDVVGVTAMHRLATLADLATSVVKVEDGESLAEAIDREAKAKEASGTLPPGERRFATGELVSTVVELFANSPTVWLRTKRGIWFIPVRTGEMFLAPCHEPENAGLFYLGEAMTEKGWSGKTTFRRVREEPMSLDIAMAWAERSASEAESMLHGQAHRGADRSASWRQGSRPATRAQREILGAACPATKAEAADMIAIKLASQRLDRVFSPRKRKTA
jgi:superfamily II DNA or RNA helicase